jgi:hypothetical protein
MERVIKEGCINRGSDNIFTNDFIEDPTSNNIERVDFVYKNGVATTQLNAVGFLITERGGNDPFKMAAITGIDANQNPTSFGPLITVSAASYGASIMDVVTYVMRKDVGDNVLRPFSTLPLQSIKSVFISLNNLSVASNQRVYGYALMGNDVTATTTAELLNYTSNTLFPRNTMNANGGMDMVAAPGIFSENNLLAVNTFNFTNQNKDCDQLLQWQDDNYGNVREYQLEKSFDGNFFEKMASINTGSTATYSFTDKFFDASCFYRLNGILKNGQSKYSIILSVKNNCTTGNISLYPNPANNQLTVSLDGNKRANKVSVYTKDGKDCGNWTVNTNSSTLQFDISNLPSGQYFIKLFLLSGAIQVFPVIKR